MMTGAATLYSLILVVRTGFEPVFIPPHNFLYRRARRTLVVCALPIQPPDYVQLLKKIPYELPTSPTYDSEKLSVRESASTFADVPAPISVFVVPRSNDFVVRTGFEPVMQPCTVTTRVGVHPTIVATVYLRLLFRHLTIYPHLEIEDE
jgi:hypothetical protein